MTIQKYNSLDLRYSSILLTIVEGYINRCQPISSQYVQKKLLTDLSSATIRNVMSSLEKDGFLKQVHKSGGRIPTDLGYRFYINSINSNNNVNEDVIPELEDELKTVSSNVDEILNATATMLSDLSNMFSIVMISEYQNSILVDIELIELNGNRVMMVIGMDNGLVKSIVLDLDINIKEKHIKSITKLLKDKLVGLSLSEIQNTITYRLNDSSVFNHELIQILINDCYSYFSIENNKLIYTSPANVLLQQPEFQNINNFKKILPALDKSFLNIYMNKNFDAEHDYDLIGKENEDKIFNNCAILTSKFETKAITGRIGVIGPKRLNYINVKNILNTFRKVVQNAI
ncbi:MAG: heat-inducible transcriptional repressor HrcA [Candidatus Neomarinimicrobiota bacterium]|tara:strand:+ start:2375 stop:3406 length:1032 start_codon:yes stop_codon:yes gene_type:complete